MANAQMTARVKWAEARTFIGTSGTGHSIVFGTKNGDDTATPGASPMELVLLGTGGCSAYDVVSILEKGRQKIDDVTVQLSAERAAEDPKVFVNVHMAFTVTGRDVDPAKVARAISLSVDKYCSASAMIAKTAAVTHSFEVVQDGAA